MVKIMFSPLHTCSLPKCHYGKYVRLTVRLSVCLSACLCLYVCVHVDTDRMFWPIITKVVHICSPATLLHLEKVSMPIYREVRQYQHQISPLVAILDLTIKTVVNIAYRILIYLSTNYVKNNRFYADVTDYDAWYWIILLYQGLLLECHVKKPLRKEWKDKSLWLEKYPKQDYVISKSP